MLGYLSEPRPRISAASRCWREKGSNAAHGTRPAELPTLLAIMKRAFKNAVKRWLRSRGLVIKPVDPYAEKLEEIRYAWLRELGVGTVIDVGAGDGGFARKALAWFPDASFYCFEPLESQFTGLQERFGNREQFTLVQAALGNRPGPVRFFENRYAGSSSMLEMAAAHKTAYPFTEIAHETRQDCTTLDLFFTERMLAPAVFLKLDVQGGELLVLEGGLDLLKRTMAVYLEVSFCELYLGQPLIEDVARFLRGAGFHLVGIDNVSQSLVDGRFLQADAIFLRSSPEPASTTK
jgi:FkbM family methyltransferase